MLRSPRRRHNGEINARGDASGEQAFLLTVARAYAMTEPEGSVSERLAAIAPRITSWERVARLLNIHRCRALAYEVLKPAEVRDSGCIPEDFFAELREWYGAMFVRAALERSTLHRVLGAFQKAEIPVLYIKGMALGTWLYGDPALREHDDIDFLAPAGMTAEIDQVLKQLGYTSGYRPPLYPGELPGMASYLDPQGGLSIDLSFDPLYVFGESLASRRRSFETWWSRRQYLTIGSESVPAPGAEDQFVQLARHLQFHGYFRTNWAVDVLLLLHRYGNALDWPLIAREASAVGIAGGLYRTLEILSATYSVAIPRPAAALLRPNAAARAMHRRVWPDGLAVPRERPLKNQEGTPILPRFITPRGVHPVAGLMLFLLDSRRKQTVTYLVHRALPPRSWLRERYGRGMYPVLLRKHLRDLRKLRQQVQQSRR